jgi:NTP pyrophosphatase (non-canonical NTP hydrolase)
LSDFGRSDLVGPLEESKLALGLHVLAGVQFEVGLAIPGWSEGEPEFVRTTFLALVKEVMELLDYFDWKQWKLPTETDAGEAADEFADVLAFLGYVVLFLGYRGVMPDDLARAYAKKTLVNQERLAGKIEGYGTQ